jgi:hypothetical protein
VAILSVQHAGGELRLLLAGPAGRRVQLESTASLAPETWTPAGAVVRLQGDSVLLTERPAQEASRGFLRVRVLAD